MFIKKLIQRSLLKKIMEYETNMIEFETDAINHIDHNCADSDSKELAIEYKHGLKYGHIETLNYLREMYKNL